MAYLVGVAAGLFIAANPHRRIHALVRYASYSASAAIALTCACSLSVASLASLSFPLILLVVCSAVVALEQLQDGPETMVGS